MEISVLGELGLAASMYEFFRYLTTKYAGRQYPTSTAYR